MLWMRKVKIREMNNLIKNLKRESDKVGIRDSVGDLYHLVPRGISLILGHEDNLSVINPHLSQHKSINNIQNV